MMTNVLLSLIQTATQVVWASIFFCRTEADALSIRHDETYEESTQKASVTVRAVDGSYMYVIGKEQVLRGADKLLPRATIRRGPVEEMDFPE